MRSYKGLVAALEEEQMIEAAVADARPVAPTIPNAAESPESAMLEVNEIATIGTMDNQEITNALNVSETLDELNEVVGIAEQQGGLSVESLQIFNITLKHNYKRVGIVNKNISMEGYAEPSKKLTAQIAMESIKEKAQQILKAIIEAIKRGIQWIKNFFSSLFNATKGMIIRAKKLKELANKSTGTGELSNSEELFHKLSVNGSVDLVKSARIIEQDPQHSMLDIFKKIVNTSTLLCNVSYEGGSPESVNKEMKIIAERVIAFYKTNVDYVYPGELTLSLDIEGIEKISKSIVPNHIVYQVLDGDDINTIDLITKALHLIQSTYRFVPKDKKDNSSTKAVLKSLSSEDIKTSMDVVISILEQVHSFEKEANSLEKECQKMIDKNDKKLDDVWFDMKMKLRRSLLKIASVNLSAGSTICNQSLKLMINFSKAAMDYCEKSIKQAGHENQSIKSFQTT